MIRAFIAIGIPEAVKRDIAALQRAFQAEGPVPKVRWVQPDSLHLTLKFLGNVEALQIPRIEEALRESVRHHEPLTLRPVGCGAFPSPSKARVLWIGLTGDLDRLTRLQASIETHLSAAGFPREERPFTPHLTIGRIKEPLRGEQMGRMLFAHRTFQSSAFVVKEVLLFRSTLTPEGSLYTPLFRAPLPLRPSQRIESVRR